MFINFICLSLFINVFFVSILFFSGKACVAFHSYGSSVRCMYPLKNNPSLGMGHGPEANKSHVGLFREHEVRDACVQTDPGISGTWGYPSRDPSLAKQNKGQCSFLSLKLPLKLHGKTLVLSEESLRFAILPVRLVFIITAKTAVKVRYSLMKKEQMFLRKSKMVFELVTNFP